MKKIFALLLTASFVLTAYAQVQLGSDIDGEAAGDQSGWSVSMSSDGKIVAIGAKDNRGSRGQVRVYKYQSGAWTQLGSDIDGEAARDQSGYSVSISSDGSIVAIGANRNGVNGAEAGHVRVYKYQSSAWTQLGSDIDGEAAADYSGIAVSISSDGSIVAIGAIWNDGNGSNAGHVRVYKYQSGAWTQLGSDIDGEAAGDYSCRSVSISGDGSLIAIGAELNDGNGSSAGHVQVYKYASGAWAKMGSDIDGEAAEDGSGYSVSFSSNDSIVAIGAPWAKDGNGIASGHVRVFKFKNCPPDTTTENIVACGAYTWKDGKTYTSNNKTACWKLFKKSGCDSIIRLNLTLKFPNDTLMPKICAVSIDSASSKNIVVWEKQGLNRATKYNVYRENTSSQFVKIGTVHRDSLSTFIDTGSYPLKQSYSYKLTIRDSCGQETLLDLSTTHKTVHLTSNVGVGGEVNLIWNLYEGKSYTSHNIMRSANGGAFVKIAQVASNISAFSDLTPPSGSLIYKISLSSNVCRPSRSTYGVIQSNPVYIRPSAVNGIENLSFSMSPNPASSVIEIQSQNSFSKVEILDIEGRLVKELMLDSNSYKVDVSGLCVGVYFVKVTYQGLGTVVQKVLID